MVLQPNRQLHCSYTPLVSMRVGLGVTDVESKVTLVSPHSSPLQRGRVRWLVTRPFCFEIKVLNMSRTLKPMLVFEFSVWETQTARSHLSTLASFLSISSFPKQTSFVLLILYFGGKTWKHKFRG